ncbi:MAG: hypothetical protein L6R39_001973 [Caloplaca ligustica]|nr:MAG: hypothetical protein L6R39_001973 [Caloplaca ligustica]
MAEDGPNTQSSFPSSISRPSQISVSSITDTPFPTSLITDPTVPSPLPSTTSDNLSTTTDATPATSTAPSSPTVSETTSQASAAPTVAAPTTAQPALTKPQIAGVTVGSVAAAGLVFGLLALVFCLRDRRKKRRRSDASFGNDKIVIDEPRGPSPPAPPPSGPAFQDVEYGPQDVGPGEPFRAQAEIARPHSNQWNFWRKSVKPEDIGVAVAQTPLPHAARDPSPITPMSAASYETTSRLLPDKPIYSLYPPPLRISSHNQDVSPVEGPGPVAAGFGRALPGLVPKPVPRGRGIMNTSQIGLHLSHPALRSVSSDPFLDSPSSDQPADSRQFPTLPAQRARAAPPNPAFVHYGQRAEPAEVQRKPVPARLPPDNSLRTDPSIERLDWGLNAPLQTTAPAAEPPVVPSVHQPAQRKSSGKRKFSGKRPMTFLSNASDTSFEDADSDDEPPPLPQSTLSPVVESPASRPRVVGVRYPVIPTSATESLSVNRTIRQVRREEMELSPASDRSMGRARARPKTPSPTDKALPKVPELAGTELRERQQAPDSSRNSPKPGSAKWNVLVAPGLEGIENAGTPRSKTSAEWTPTSTPTRKGKRRSDV